MKKCVFLFYIRANVILMYSANPPPLPPPQPHPTLSELLPCFTVYGTLLAKAVKSWDRMIIVLIGWIPIDWLV